MGVYVGDNLVAGNVGEVYTKAQVDTMIANAVALAEPVGSIKPFAGTTVPDGYLLCDGSAISRTTYAALFAVIGTAYGTGDGSTTFNLPNFTDNKVPLGVGGSANIGRYNAGEVPNITGWAALQNNKGTGGACYEYSSGIYPAAAAQGTGIRFGFDASRSSSVYKDVSRVIAHGVMMFYCIKY